MLRVLFIGLTISVLVVFFTPLQSYAQQDAQFTQYQANPLIFNPAFAGGSQALDITAVARSQWVGLDGAPQSQSLSAHLPLYKFSSGAGLVILNDIAGAERTTSGWLTYAYRLKIDNNSSLSFGLSAGFIQRGLDGSKIRTPQGSYEGGQINHQDDFLPIGFASNVAPDFGFGIHYNIASFDFGASVTHLTAPDVTLQLSEGTSSQSYARHVYVTSAYEFDLGERFSLLPSVLFKSDLINFMVDFSTLLQYKDNIWLGSSFRTYFGPQADAVAGILGANVSTRFGIGYSYDYTLSDLGNVSSGSHEVVLKYQIPMERPRAGKRINNLRYLQY